LEIAGYHQLPVQRFGDCGKTYRTPRENRLVQRVTAAVAPREPIGNMNCCSDQHLRRTTFGGLMEF